MASAIIKILSGDVFLRFSSISFISLDIRNSSKPHNPISSERRAFWKDSLKFLPSKKVNNDTPIEITDKNESSNELIRNILSINGVTGIFLSDDFLSVNKKEKIQWEDLKHIIISFINDYYADGNEIVIDNTNEQYQRYLTAPSEAKHITNSEKIRDEIRNKIEQIFINKIINN